MWAMGKGATVSEGGAMRERAILFSSPKIRAILDDRKTMAREVVKPQPEPEWWPVQNTVAGCTDAVFLEEGSNAGQRIEHRIRCPYRVGMSLWVRETWQTCSGGYVPGVRFVADGTEVFPEFENLDALPRDWQDFNKKRSPIHMPRWVSRITLEVVSVRVERVQEISEADAKAEGVTPDLEDSGGQNQDGSWISIPRYVYSFRDLWDSIHAKRGYGWDANPLVWVVEFRRAGQEK